MDREEAATEPLAHLPAQMRARRKDRVRIDVAADFACDIRFAWRCQRLRNKSRLERRVAEDRRERIHQAVIAVGILARAQGGDIRDQDT